MVDTLSVTEDDMNRDPYMTYITTGLRDTWDVEY